MGWLDNIKVFLFGVDIEGLYKKNEQRYITMKNEYEKEKDLNKKGLLKNKLKEELIKNAGMYIRKGE